MVHKLNTSLLYIHHHILFINRLLNRVFLLHLAIVRSTIKKNKYDTVFTVKGLFLSPLNMQIVNIVHPEAQKKIPLEERKPINT